MGLNAQSPLGMGETILHGGPRIFNCSGTVHRLQEEMLEVQPGESTKDRCAPRVRAFALKGVEDLFHGVHERWGGRTAKREISGATSDIGKSNISRRIGEACVAKPFESELARVATATGETLLVRIIATLRHSVVDAKLDPATNDLRFREIDEWRANANRIGALDATTRGQIGGALERRDVFGATIGIA